MSEKRNCTNPLGSAVYAGNSRKECFTHFYLSLPSFLLQVITGTPPAPTMPGGLLLVDSQTTGSANHPPCSTPLSFSFSPTPSCLLFTCSSLCLPRQDRILHPTSEKQFLIPQLHPSLWESLIFFYTLFINVIKAPLHYISLLGFMFQFLIKYVETRPGSTSVANSVIFLFWSV